MFIKIWICKFCYFANHVEHSSTRQIIITLWSLQKDIASHEHISNFPNLYILKWRSFNLFDVFCKISFSIASNSMTFSLSSSSVCSLWSASADSLWVKEGIVWWDGREKLWCFHTTDIDIELPIFMALGFEHALRAFLIIWETFARSMRTLSYSFCFYIFGE